MPITSIFSFSHNVFLLFSKIISIFNSHLNCRLQKLSIWTSTKFCCLVKLILSKTSFGFFQNQPWFLHVCSTNLSKTLWEKEKLLVKSNFSFSHSVFFILLENFLPFSSNLKLSSANSFSFEESKICCLGKD